MADKKLGFHQNSWIGDTKGAFAVTRRGVSTAERGEANAVYDYLESKGRKPKMFAVPWWTAPSGWKSWFVVATQKKVIDNLKKRHPKTKKISR